MKQRDRRRIPRKSTDIELPSRRKKPRRPMKDRERGRKKNDCLEQKQKEKEREIEREKKTIT